MWKVMKLVLGLAVLAGVGLLYGQFNEVIDERKEEKLYAVISFSYPNEGAKSTLVKRTPESKCEKWRKDYFSASREQCGNCVVVANECKRSIPETYQKAFEQEKLEVSYIYKPYKYPEVLMLEGLPAGGFSQMCAQQKQSFEATECFE